MNDDWMPAFAKIANEPRARKVGPKKQIDDPREFLTAVMNEDPEVMNSDYLSMRLRAAIELLPFSHPKLAVVAQVTENDIATLLDRRIKRYEEMQARTIEAKPAQTIDQPIDPPQLEPSKPLARTLDRRYRRL
jgi:hypothetical protein